MICNQCKVKNSETNNFCNQCGNRLEKQKPDAFPEAVSTEKPSNSKLDLGTVQYGKVFLAFGLVFFIILGAAISSMSSPTSTNSAPAASASPKSNPSDFLTDTQISAIAETLCPAVKSSLSSDLDVKQYLTDAKQNSSSVTSAAKDAWASAAWKKKNPSWFSGQSYSAQVAANINFTIASNLDREIVAVLDSKEASRYKENNSNWGDWASYFYQPVVKACGLTKTVQVLSEYDSKLQTISSQAENIPWYPKGFSEIPGYPGFALGKTNGSCSYSFGSCAIFNIVSQTGCPTNLYVEANGLNGDVVTSWGNDTARVAAGQVARIEITFSDNVDTWELTKISCY